MQRTWIAITDGAKADIYAYHGPKQKLELLDSLSHVNAPSRELMATERGRGHDDGPNQRSAFDRPTDPHEYEKHRFAREVADYLAEHLDRYDRLYLCAAPKQLGELRENLSQHVNSKISEVMDKDLTNLPRASLRERLQDVLPIEVSTSDLPPDVKYAKA